MKEASFTGSSKERPISGRSADC